MAGVQSVQQWLPKLVEAYKEAKTQYEAQKRELQEQGVEFRPEGGPLEERSDVKAEKPASSQNSGGAVERRKRAGGKVRSQSADRTPGNTVQGSRLPNVQGSRLPNVQGSRLPAVQSSRLLTVQTHRLPTVERQWRETQKQFERLMAIQQQLRLIQEALDRQLYWIGKRVNATASLTASAGRQRRYPLKKASLSLFHGKVK